MIRKLALLFVFLATLSMVYAFPYHLNKRAANFGQCQGLPPSSKATVISNVTLSPDPPKAGSNLEVKGSATTETNIDKDDLFFFVMFDTNNNALFVPEPFNICAKTECPTTTFNFDENYDLSTVPSLPEDFLVAIVIAPNLTDPLAAKACGEALFPEQ
ncbi:6013_t:CDS:1 [Cetraspora pellucida]|uniref:Phosphatidylglycerol/phosphatidylinositol transfer protein n=1 Tax=Cetraspora pellucida TaxID=1433469 RepID=A0A9N9JJV1_9GLOM|nr:6013_t:CDS:1 [Cetraspora pellucida]